MFKIISSEKIVIFKKSHHAVTKLDTLLCGTGHIYIFFFFFFLKLKQKLRRKQTETEVGAYLFFFRVFSSVFFLVGGGAF